MGAPSHQRVALELFTSSNPRPQLQAGHPASVRQAVKYLLALSEHVLDMDTKPVSPTMIAQLYRLRVTLAAAGYDTSTLEREIFTLKTYSQVVEAMQMHPNPVGRARDIADIYSEVTRL